MSHFCHVLPKRIVVRSKLLECFFVYFSWFRGLIGCLLRQENRSPIPMMAECLQPLVEIIENVEIKVGNTVVQLARAHQTLQSNPQKPGSRFPIPDSRFFPPEAIQVMFILAENLQNCFLFCLISGFNSQSSENRFDILPSILRPSCDVGLMTSAETFPKGFSRPSDMNEWFIRVSD